MIFFGYLTPFFLTGSYANIFAMSLLPGEVSVNFFQWLLYSLPALIIFSGGMLWAIITMFKPEHSGKKLAVETIDEQLAILGRFTREEIVTAVVTSGVIVMLMFQGVHKIDSTWIMAIGLCILVLGGVLDNKTLKNGIDWPFLIFIGIALSFVNAIEQLGLVESVSGIMTNIMRPFMINQYLFLTALSIIVLIVAFIINDDPALILFVVSMYPIFMKLGINPWVLVFILGVTSAPFFFPYQSPIYLTAYYSSNEKAFTHKQGQKLSIIFAVVSVATIVLSIPYWRLLGLMK
jgi:di/tricarboxylate transporter